VGKTAINRQQLGLAIANIDGAIKRINELKYVVKSQNGNGDYDVNSTSTTTTTFAPLILRYIGAQVYKRQGDIRDVINIGRLLKKNDGPAEIQRIMQTLMKYGPERNDESQGQQQT
jgi:hypothetical protein